MGPLTRRLLAVEEARRALQRSLRLVGPVERAVARSCRQTDWAALLAVRTAQQAAVFAATHPHSLTARLNTTRKDI